MKVLVTGSSNGIGKAITEKFLKENHEVIGIDIDKQTIFNDNYTHIQESILSNNLPEFNDINILINNAGVQNSIDDIDKDGDDWKDGFGFCGPAFEVEEEGGSGKKYEEDATPGVAGVKVFAVLDEDALDGCPLVAVLTCHLVVGTAAETEVAAEEETEEDASNGGTCRDVECTKETFAVGIGVAGGGFFKTEDGHEDGQYVGKDKTHGRSAEFVVEGEVVEQPFVEPHEVATPREEDGKECGSEYPPAFGAAHSEHAKEEDEDDDGTEVDGTAGEGLVAPVKGYFVLMEIGIRGTGFADRFDAAATAGTRNEEGVGLANAVAPAEGVVDVEAIVVEVVVAGEFFTVDVLGRDGDFAATTHGVLHVFLVDEEMADVAGQGKEDGDNEDAGREKELGEVFVLERDDGIGDAHEETGDGGVEGYLYVVEGNLETESEEEEYAAPDEHAQSFLFVVAKTSGTFKD